MLLLVFFCNWLTLYCTALLSPCKRHFVISMMMMVAEVTSPYLSWPVYPLTRGALDILILRPSKDFTMLFVVFETDLVSVTVFISVPGICIYLISFVVYRKSRSRSRSSSATRKLKLVDYWLNGLKSLILSYDQLQAALLIGRNAITWHWPWYSVELRQCNIASRPKYTNYSTAALTPTM